jgi:hypothetical protein
MFARLISGTLHVPTGRSRRTVLLHTKYNEVFNIESRKNEGHPQRTRPSDEENEDKDSANERKLEQAAI